jgi:hypothetical protein
MCGITGALPCWEAGSRATRWVASSTPSRAGRQGPEQRDAWHRHRPPELGGRVRSHGTWSIAGALPSGEVGSDVVGRVVVCGQIACPLS